MTNLKEVFALHRYYIWANKMRIDFDTLLEHQVKGTIDKEEFEIESFLYMSYWYSALYVVVEGWLDLKLSDTVINGLLQSPNVDLLKRYRNGVFHFQKEYYDNRFIEFMSEGKDSVKWVRNLNQEFGRWFLESFKRSMK
jgi:hypothetical protein